LMKSNSGSAFTFSVEGSKVVEKIWINNYFAHLQTV
jgi:hypothetical protein